MQNKEEGVESGAAEKNHKSGPINAHVWPLDARNPRKTINPVDARGVSIKLFFLFFLNELDRTFAYASRSS